MSSTLIFVGLPENSKSSITRTECNGHIQSKKNLVKSASVESVSVNHLDAGGKKDKSDGVREELQAVTDLRNASLRSSATLTRLERTDIGVPNAPKSCIAEIFSSDATDHAPRMNGSTRPRVVRDTPTRPRDTHSRLFGQAVSQQVAPMVTDTIRSNIKFDEPRIVNGDSPSHSPKMNGTPIKMTNGTPKLTNGSASSTPSRGERGSAEHSSYVPPKRNPVTGDGVILPTPRRRHPAAGREGNPITGDGYKSMNGQINTVTSINGSSHLFHNTRVPPGGFSSGLW